MEAKKQVYSFSAGPSVFPREVLKKAQEELLDWNGIKKLIFYYNYVKKDVEYL